MSEDAPNGGYDIEAPIERLLMQDLGRMLTRRGDRKARLTVDFEGGQIVRYHCDFGQHDDD